METDDENVYNLNAFQISSEKFRLDVLYLTMLPEVMCVSCPEPNEPKIANKKSYQSTQCR